VAHWADNIFGIAPRDSARNPRNLFGLASLEIKFPLRLTLTFGGDWKLNLRRLWHGNGTNQVHRKNENNWGLKD